MKSSEFKKLVKAVLKESSKAKSEEPFIRYLFDKIGPKVQQLTKNVVELDKNNGAFGWFVNTTYQGKDVDVIYASPMWTDMNKIDVQLSFKDEGIKNLPSIPFPIKNWTGDVDKDSKLYIKTILSYISKNITKQKISEESSTGAVAGYSTPFAFTKNKKGSPKGIAAAKKYGKVVGESPRI